LSVETSVLSAGIKNDTRLHPMRKQKDVWKWQLFCGVIKNSEYKLVSIILKWLDAIAGICDLFTLKKSTIWYVEVIDVN
jgi:hypothetical protein